MGKRHPEIFGPNPVSPPTHSRLTDLSICWLLDLAFQFAEEGMQPGPDLWSDLAGHGQPAVATGPAASSERYSQYSTGIE